MSSQCPYCGGLVYVNPNRVNAPPIDLPEPFTFRTGTPEGKPLLNEGTKRQKALGAVLKEADKTVKKYTKAELQEKQVEALKELLEELRLDYKSGYIHNPATFDQLIQYKINKLDGK